MWTSIFSRPQIRITSAHNGFADVSTAIFWIRGRQCSQKMDLRTLIQRKYGFADFNTAKKKIADLNTAFWGIGGL